MSRLSIYSASRRDVEGRTLARVPYVLISIHDPVEPPPRLRPCELRRAVMTFAFDDASPSDDLEDDFVLMTLDDARAIWRSVGEHLHKVRSIVVHCEQGFSRSPAVAAGLMMGLGVNPADVFETCQPNPYVLRLMLEARESWSPRPPAVPIEHAANENG